MPHLSQLQRDYRDKQVTIISLTSGDKRNTLEKVEQMVEGKGDVMDFTVAWDIERKTNEAYMKASGQRGIPASFLIDQTGKIAWIGHPDGVDLPMAMVVAKTWDHEQGPALLKRIHEQKRAIYAAVDSDPKHALELLTAFEEAYPLAAKGMDSLRFEILTQLPDRAAEAEAAGRKLVEREIAAENAQALNAFAWSLVDPGVSLENRFLGLAQLAADKANELSGGKDPSILDTAARVYFWRGDLTQAVELQRRAVENAEGKLKEALQPALDEYEQAVRDERSS